MHIQAQKDHGLDFDPNAVAVPDGLHLIDGQPVSGGVGGMAMMRPSDAQVIGELPDAGPDLVDRAVSCAAAARVSSGWSTQAPRARARVLRRWADLIDANAQEIARLEAIVSTRVITEAMARDVVVFAEVLRFYAEYTDKLDGAVTPTSDDILSLTLREPHGVVAAITPWNFPLILSSWKVAPALAAGNAVVLKPSEMTPLSILKVAALGVEAGLPPGLFNIVQGTGAVTGAALVKHPDVGLITFTGSTRTGAQIMSDAAFNGMKPVSLELGGKSPQVVFEDCGDLDQVADMIARGFCYNAGQVCFAGSRLLVHRTIEDVILEKVRERLSAFRPGPTWHQTTTLPPIVNGGQADRIERLVDATLSEGAELVCGGHPLAPPDDETAAARFFAPTILRGVQPGMTGHTEEIFGPVLAVQTFSDDDEAMRLADHPIYGLVASVHTRDISRALRAAKGIQAGTVWINSFGRGADMTSPFGGYKQSGIGKDMGRAGYEKYTKSKSIWIQL